jgi:hypothetical protein
VLNAGELEIAINEADRVGLVNPDALRSATTARSGLRGIAAIRETCWTAAPFGLPTRNWSAASFGSLIALGWYAH